ncbi:MAG: hypothetical protein V7731_01310 [Amphritea sp.]
MAYNIHINKTKNDARSTSPVVSLDIMEHAELFCQNKEILGKFINVNGMSNYYGDAVYIGHEIVVLKAELEEMAELLCNDKDACSVIVKILSMVEKASLENMNIYCFSE